MDRLGAMETFVAIVERGSMTAAAEALDRSQPAVVRSLAALEKHLGATLLQRTTRRMSLTPEGRDFLARCKRILADVDEAERALGPVDGAPSGTLRVTAPLEFGRRHVQPVISRFLGRFPRMHVDLLLHDRNVDLVEEGMDLGVRIGHLPDSSLVGIRVGDMRRVVVAAPALIEGVGEPAAPGDLAAAPCVLVTAIPGRRGVWRFGPEDAGEEVAVSGRFSTNQVAAGVTACIDGLGFGRFLRYQVREALEAGRLRTVLEDHEPAPSPVSLVYPGGRFVTPRLRALIDQLRTDLGAALDRR